MPNAVCAYAGAAGACSARTFAQSQSSSSASTIGIDVQMPWPISECLSRIVTVLSGAIRTNAFGDTGGAFAASCAMPRRIATGMQKPTTKPVAAVFRKSRRFTARVFVMPKGSRHMTGLLHQFRCGVHGGTNALIRSAPANVAAHGGVDIRVGRFRRHCQQRGGGHDLPGLAIAALHDIDIDPRALHGMTRIGGKSFDGRDLLAGDSRRGRYARAQRRAVDMHRASAALRHAATEFRASQSDNIADDPKQRHVVRNVYVMRLSVDRKLHLAFSRWMIEAYSSSLASPAADA